MMPGAKGGGDFAMTPQGTINTVLWSDLATRSLHEQAINTKLVARFFYGRAADYSYFDGGSQGGRQAFSLAQNYPDDYDGILFRYPAVNFTRLITGEMYPHIVFQRDLGGVPLSEDQEDLLSKAAIHACDVVGGQHLGYIMDPASCHYDPSKDLDVLCKSEGGRSESAACVTRVQAIVMNKIWYGLTRDGSVPDPAIDNGWGPSLTGNHLWFGPVRGTSLYGATSRRLYGVSVGVAIPSGPFSIATDMLALELQNPTMAGHNFENATGDGGDLWKTLSYIQLANAYDRGVALQEAFAHINTDNPELIAFKAHGRKMLGWHGLSDEVIPVEGTLNYVDRVAQTMGGIANLKGFLKLYLVPGSGHGFINGSANPDSSAPVLRPTELYERLILWVEKGTSPGRIDISSPDSAPMRVSAPLCPYPGKPAYQGGDPRVAASYTCS